MSNDLISIQCHRTYDNSEGALCVAESSSVGLPFIIKRVYYIYGAKNGTVRGNHAHKALKQVLICVYGKIEVTLDKGNGEVNSILLSDPSTGLFVGPSTWRTMKWLQNDSVLLVLASEHYNADDYIRDYEKFITWINQRSHDDENNNSMQCIKTRL